MKRQPENVYLNGKQRSADFNAKQGFQAAYVLR